MSSLLHRMGALRPLPRSSRPREQGAPPAPSPWHALPVGAGQLRVVKFTNCLVFHAARGLCREDLWVRDGRVIDPASRFWEAATFSEFACDLVVDCGGHVLCAGFVDLQFNGGWGVDYSAPGLKEADVLHVGHRLLETGVTTVCPTLVSVPAERYSTVLPLFRSLATRVAAANAAAVRGGVGIAGGGRARLGSTGGEGDDLAPLIQAGARIAGLHLEGPFMHPDRRGAHPLHCLRHPVPQPGESAFVDAAAAIAAAATSSGVSGGCGSDGSNAAGGGSSVEDCARLDVTPCAINLDDDGEVLSSLERVYGPVDWACGEVRIVTLAPELNGGLAATRALASAGVLVSIGHTTAGIHTADAAVEAGAALVTHLFNAMTAFHHRDPGVVGLLGRRPKWGDDVEGGADAAAVGEASAQGPAVSNTTDAPPASGTYAFKAPPPLHAPRSPISAAAALLAPIEHVTFSTHLPPRRDFAHRELGSSESMCATPLRHAGSGGFAAVEDRGVAATLTATTPRPFSRYGAWAAGGVGGFGGASLMGGAPAFSLLDSAEGSGSAETPEEGEGGEAPPRASSALTLEAELRPSNATAVDGVVATHHHVRDALDHTESGRPAAALHAAAAAAGVTREQPRSSCTPMTPAGTRPGVRAATLVNEAARAAALAGDRAAEVAAAASAAGARAASRTRNDGSRSALARPCAGVTSVGDAVAACRPFYSLIADGVHVHPYAVSIAWETHPAGLILVTDAICALGLPPGRHRLGEQVVDILGGSDVGEGAYAGVHAVIAGTSTLAGAVVPLDACLNRFMSFTGAPLPSALAAVTAHPAAALGLGHLIGGLGVGAWADIVLLEVGEGGGGKGGAAHVSVLQTWMGGVLAWKRS